MLLRKHRRFFHGSSREDIAPDENAASTLHASPPSTIWTSPRFVGAGQGYRAGLPRCITPGIRLEYDERADPAGLGSLGSAGFHTSRTGVQPIQGSSRESKSSPGGVPCGRAPGL